MSSETEFLAAVDEVGADFDQGEYVLWASVRVNAATGVPGASLTSATVYFSSYLFVREAAPPQMAEAAPTAEDTVGLGTTEAVEAQPFERPDLEGMLDVEKPSHA